MADLVVGMAVLSALSLAAFLLVPRILRPGGRRACDAVATLIFTGLVLYIVLLWDTPRLAALLPFSNLIIVGNWFPVVTSALAGLVWRRPLKTPVRTYVAVSALLTVGFYSVVYPLQGRPPQCGDEWAGSVCLQTDRYTCTPASAATLLRAHGIAATEQEMAELCLTRRGTTWTGLYRGLKKKTAGTGLEVEVFECDLDGLRRRAHEGPVVLSVMLEDGTGPNSVYVRECGWIPGQPHSVVLYRFVGEGVIIGDPSQGREVWPRKDLEVLWHGQGVRLVPRQALARL